MDEDRKLYEKHRSESGADVIMDTSSEEDWRTALRKGEAPPDGGGNAVGIPAETGGSESQ